jgi:hypothetical protein
VQIHTKHLIYVRNCSEDPLIGLLSVTHNRVNGIMTIRSAKCLAGGSASSQSGHRNSPLIPEPISSDRWQGMENRPFPTLSVINDRSELPGIGMTPNRSPFERPIPSVSTVIV